MAAQNGAYEATLSATAGNAGVLSLANPEGVALIVTDVILYLTTPSSGACTVDAGITTAAASSDNLIDGQSIAVAGAYGEKGTNGKLFQKWAADAYLTITVASGTVTGLVGKAYVRYTRPS